MKQGSLIAASGLGSVKYCTTVSQLNHEIAKRTAGKPSIVAVSVLLMLILLGFGQIDAQVKSKGETPQLPYLCNTDCPDQPFDPINASATAIFTFAGCVWEVDYWYRYTDGCPTGTYCDIQVRQIRSRSSPPCTTLTTSQIFNAAAFQAIKHAIQSGNLPANCAPVFPNCATNWRVEAGACWTKSFQIISPLGENPYPLLTVGPCFAEENCCYFSYTVCEDQYGNLVVTQTGGGYSTTVCPPGCTKICGQ